MAALGHTQKQKSAHEHRGMTIRVLVADDQALVRGRAGRICTLMGRR
jgi:hypothetical protein